MEALPCDDKVANVGLIIELLVQSGRAGDNAKQIPAPEFGSVDGVDVNLRWRSDRGLGPTRRDADRHIVLNDLDGAAAGLLGGVLEPVLQIEVGPDRQADVDVEPQPRPFP